VVTLNKNKFTVQSLLKKPVFLYSALFSAFEDKIDAMLFLVETLKGSPVVFS
jgi:hypothetical protein